MKAVTLFFVLVATIYAQTCPAGTCPATETCCSLGNGNFGCCPYPNADCCTDHAHCCPNGYKCDISKGQCVKSAALVSGPVVTALHKIQASAPMACPAGTCSTGETCCDIGGGQFGCCPYPNADCCSDKAHCCPNGYKCDISKGQCVKSTMSMPHARMMPLKIQEVKPMACPAGTCPSTETCCDIGGGQFGCCPYPNADCCTDKAHCCPSGYKCDISKGQCVKAALHSFARHGVHLALRKIIGIQASAPMACPAGTCPSTETCCDIGGGQFGCCPYPNADCCTDKAHCCPNGYKCDISKGQCVKATHGSMVQTVRLTSVKGV